MTFVLVALGRRRRRRRRALEAAGDAVGLLDEHHADALRARDDGHRREVARRHASARPVTQDERAARRVGARCRWAPAGPCGVSTWSVLTRVMLGPRAIGGRA